MEEVRRLGRYPTEHQAPEDPDKEKERILAKRLREARAAALFQPAEEAELAELQWVANRENDATRAEAIEERCRQKAVDVMEAVRAFGKMPRFQMRPQTEEAKQENQLRRQLDTVLKQKRLNRNELAELDEFRWMRRREDEWKAIARAQQQKETKKYKAELRARLGESECRCTCYKFNHWEGLWRQDRPKATRLRQQGWHLVGVCALLGNPKHSPC